MGLAQIPPAMWHRNHGPARNSSVKQSVSLGMESHTGDCRRAWLWSENSGVPRHNPMRQIASSRCKDGYAQRRYTLPVDPVWVGMTSSFCR